jgi:MFS superfamily sulfate permease-like transporter
VSALRATSRLPAPVVVLVTLSLLAAWLDWPVETIGSRFGGIPQSLPTLVWPDVSWDTVRQLVMPTLTIAALGAIESLLCARVADQLHAGRKHDPNQGLDALESLAQTIERRGGTLVIEQLHAQPLSLMQRSGFLERVHGWSACADPSTAGPA